MVKCTDLCVYEHPGEQRIRPTARLVLDHRKDESDGLTL